MNLTENQTTIINNLVREFTELNKTEVKTEGLIDISRIKKDTNDKLKFFNECAIQNKIAMNKIKLQIKADLQSIEKDLDSLGLYVKFIGNNGYNFSIGRKENEGIDTKSFRFEEYSHRVVTFKEYTKRISHEYGVKYLNSHSHLRDAVPFSTYIKSKEFTDIIKRLYEKTLE